MRCRECNVDLPDNYTACPLCSAKVFDDELLIKGIRTAEYPKVQPEKYKRNPFTVFVIVWLLASLISFVLLKLRILPLWEAATVFCVIPCVWTLFIRPFLIKQLYPGNFIVMNLFPSAMTCMVFDKIINGTYSQSFETYIPICALIFFAVLTIYVIAKPKKNKRAVSYPMLMMPIAVAATVFFAVTQKAVPYLWTAVLLLCVSLIVFLFATKSDEVKEELKAKFSVQ